MGKRQQQPPLDLLPVWLDPELWAAFKQSRVERKKPLTPIATTEMLRHLEKLHADGHDVDALIRKAMRNGWLDIWPDKREATAPRRTPLDTSKRYDGPTTDRETARARLKELRAKAMRGGAA